MDLIGREFGDYRIDALLAASTASRVYRASRIDQPETVAIKIIDEQLAAALGFRDRFLRDAARASTIHHPNVVEVLDSGEQGGLYYLVMELCPHGSVRTLIQRAEATAQKLHVELCLDLIRQAAEGLAFVHDHGFIHGGLNPEDLLLGPSSGVNKRGRWSVKIGGLGLAHAVEPASANDLAGSAYLSPEQRRGQEPDQRSDIFALGVVLYELLTQRVPAEIQDPEKTIEDNSVLRSVRPILPEGLDDLILCCIAQDPADRFATATELLNAIDGITNANEPAQEEAEDDSPEVADSSTANRLTLLHLGKRNNRQSLYRIEIFNSGTSIAHFSFVVRDDCGEIRYHFAPEMVSVEPDRQRTIVLTATDRRRRPPGGQVHFVVVATPDRGLPTSVPGTFDRWNRATFNARQAIAGFGALGVIAVVLLAFMFSTLLNNSSTASSASPTDVVAAVSTTIVPTVTATPSPTPAPTVTPTAPPPTPSPTSPPTTSPSIVVRRVDTTINRVALTFSVSNDAGSASKVADILRILRDRNANATFSIRGDWAASNPGLVRTITAGGNQIINETYDHQSFTGRSDRATPLSSTQRIDELSRADAILKQIDGYDMQPYYRPPFGDIGSDGGTVVERDAAKAGYTVAVLWSIDTKSWSASQTVGRMISEASAAQPGDIILFSLSDSGGAKDVTALPQIIDNLQADGRGFATVAELVGK